MPKRHILVIAIIFIFVALVGYRAYTRTPYSSFQPYVDPLPIPPVIRIKNSPTPAEISITLDQFKNKLHRDLPETIQWGYNGGSPGPTIEVERGQKLVVHWKNNLPTTHLFPTPTGMGNMEPMPDVRTVVHLHGAVVSEPEPMDRQKNNDGWPDAWITPGQSQIAEYPNDQTARLLWYHDHAMAETGRNVAAGLAGLYIIRDDYEKSLNLPAGDYEIPLVIQSRGINPNGSLYYSKDIGTEYYGNSMFVNGKMYPFLEVEPRKYRFRFLNASNARTIAVKLFETPMLTVPGPAFYQIGTDSGFLENAVKLNDPADVSAPRLTLAPAERADVIIDFKGSQGKTYILHNGSKPEDIDHALPLPQVMMIKVSKPLSAPDTSVLPRHMKPIAPISKTSATTTRSIVFSQMTMPGGSPMLQLNGASWHDPITEKPVLGTTEIWQLINTLNDTHPFHIHLVQFQILDRTRFDVDQYLKTGNIVLTGQPEAPEAGEAGWKDTVRVTPNRITRIIMTFAPYPGYYVYHCHILEHEDMDMMRPFQVIAPALNH